MTTTPGSDQSATPSCHDGVTMTCPVCQRPFTPAGRQKFCDAACRAAAYRRRRDGGMTPVVVPKGQPRKPMTVYACDGCGARAVGEQRCEECQIFMRRVGLGGTCPNCQDPISVNELLDQEVTA